MKQVRKNGDAFYGQKSENHTPLKTQDLRISRTTIAMEPRFYKCTYKLVFKKVEVSNFRYQYFGFYQYFGYFGINILV